MSDLLRRDHPELPRRIVAHTAINNEDIVEGDGLLSAALQRMASDLLSQREAIAQTIADQGLAGRVQVECYSPEVIAYDDFASDQRVFRATERLRYRLAPPDPTST